MVQGGVGEGKMNVTLVGHQNESCTTHSNGGSSGVGLLNDIRRVATNGDRLSVYITLARGRGDVRSVFADVTAV